MTARCSACWRCSARTLATALVLLPLARVARSGDGSWCGLLVGMAAVCVFLGTAGLVVAAGEGSRSVSARTIQAAWARSARTIGCSGGAGGRDLARPSCRRCRGPGRSRSRARGGTGRTRPSSRNAERVRSLAGGGVVGLALLLGFAVAVGMARRGRCAGLEAVSGRPRSPRRDGGLGDARRRGLRRRLRRGHRADAGRGRRCSPPAPRAGASRWLTVAGGGLAALAIIAAIGSPALAARGVERAYELLDTGEVARAADLARRAEELDPLSVQPVWARARTAARAGDIEAAHVFYIRATELQPENADTWHALGLFRLDVLRDACGALPGAQPRVRSIRRAGGGAPAARSSPRRGQSGAPSVVGRPPSDKPLRTGLLEGFLWKPLSGGSSSLDTRGCGQRL